MTKQFVVNAKNESPAFRPGDVVIRLTEYPGYTPGQAWHPYQRADGMVQGLDDYEVDEIKVTKVKFLKEKPVKATKPLPVSNRPAYAVVKDKEILGMFELRADARAAKKSVGGKKAGAVIVAYVPVEEIR